MNEPGISGGFIAKKMFMKQTLFRFGWVLLFFLSGSTGLFAQQADEIVQKMEDKMRGTSSYFEMSMTTVRPRYTREVTMKAWSKGDDYSLIFITGPARDKGIGFLKRKKEIWNYMPSIDRTIKMPPSMMSQSWMGSDFSNDDLVRESSMVKDYANRILREEVLNGYSCWVLEMTPKPESSVVYSKIIVWVIKEKYLQLKVDHYDEDEAIVSTITFSEFKVMGGREIPLSMEMVPMNKENNKTIITYQDAMFDIDIKDEFFSVQNLKGMK